MKFGNDEHIVVVGKTGSGKSYFCTELLSAFEAQGWRIIIIDPNNYFAHQFAEDHEPTSVRKPYKITDRLDPQKQVGFYVPSRPGWEDPILEKIYETALAWGDTIVYHDEIKGIADEHHCPLGLELIVSQGRKFHTICIVCTQRPMGIPTIIMSQSNHCIAFSVISKKDKQVIAERIAIPQFEERRNGIPKRYMFYHLHEPTMTQGKLHERIRQQRGHNERRESTERRQAGRQRAIREART